MTEIHKVQCNRCGKEEKLERVGHLSDRKYKLPDGFKKMQLDFSGTMGELCSECWRQYQALQELFIMEDIRSKVDLNDESLQANIGGSLEE